MNYFQTDTKFTEIVCFPEQNVIFPEFQAFKWNYTVYCVYNTM